MDAIIVNGAIRLWECNFFYFFTKPTFVKKKRTKILAHSKYLPLALVHICMVLSKVLIEFTMVKSYLYNTMYLYNTYLYRLQ